jgi:hypothetical protein
VRHRKCPKSTINFKYAYESFPATDQRAFYMNFRKEAKIIKNVLLPLKNEEVYMKNSNST